MILRVINVGAKRLGLLAMLAALVLAARFAFGPAPDSRAVWGRALQVDGAVECTREGSNTHWLRPGDTLAAGDTVQTAVAGEAAASLVPGLAVQLVAGTRLALEDLQMRKNGASVAQRFASVRLESGWVRFALGAPEDQRLGLRVRTRAGEVRSEWDTLFSINATTAGRLRLTCARGSLGWAGSAGQHGMLLAGQFQDCVRDTWGEVHAAVADGEAQEEIGDLLETGRRLGELERRLQNLTPWHLIVTK